MGIKKKAGLENERRVRNESGVIMRQGRSKDTYTEIQDILYKSR